MHCIVFVHLNLICLLINCYTMRHCGKHTNKNEGYEVDARMTDRRDGVMHHLETLQNLNIALPIELTEQVRALVETQRNFDAHMLLHNFYAHHYSVTLPGQRNRSEQNRYFGNQASHENFMAQNMLYPNTEDQMGALGTSSRTIKDAITTSNELVLTASDGQPTTPQDTNDLVKCFYYIELVYGYDAALKKAVLDHAATRLADSPAWHCLFANWNLLTHCFLKRDENSLARSTMLLKIISRSHDQYPPMVYSNSRISNNLDIFVELLVRIVINPEKYGFYTTDVLQTIDNLLQYELVDYSNMLELRTKLVEHVTKQEERMRGLLESELEDETDMCRLQQAQARLNSLSTVSMDDPLTVRNRTTKPTRNILFSRPAKAELNPSAIMVNPYPKIMIDRYTKEVS